MDLEFLALSCLALFIAGTVKGVIGFGVPTVSIAILSLFAEVSSVWPVIAMAALITNVWQAVNGPYLRELLFRFASLLSVSAIVTVASYFIIGIRFPSLTLLVLGAVLFLYALSQLLHFRLTPEVSNEKRSSPVVGFVQGIATGISGTFIVPMLPYLRDRKLDRERLVQTLGISFTTSSIAFGLALSINGQFTVAVTSMSLIAVIPAIIGMIVGRRIRFKLPEVMFERIFLICLLLASVNLIFRSMSIETMG